MDRYNVELASPAVKTYESLMHRFTAGEDGVKASNQIRVVDKLMDETIPFDPYCGVRLTVGAIEGVFWKSEQSAHLLYDVYPELHIIVILCILDGNEILEAVREADIKLARLCGLRVA